MRDAIASVNWSKIGKIFVGVNAGMLGLVGIGIVSIRNEEVRRRKEESRVHWTDAARWEKPGRDY